jgi:hypothetical protein
MKKFFNVFAYIGILLLCAFARPVFADPTLNIGIINVAQVPGNYVVTLQLQPAEIPSLNGFTLLGLIDPDDMDMPIGDIRTLPTNMNGGYINVSMALNYNPAGYAFQFCLVENGDLVTQGGQYNFNPNDPDYDPLHCTGISWYQPGQQSGGGNNVTFQSTPSVNMNNNGGNGTLAADYNGILNLESIGSIGIGNIKVGVKFSDTTIPLSYSGPFDEEFLGNIDPSLNDLPGGAFGGMYNNGGQFVAGQDYYVLFKVMPSNSNASFTGDSELVTFSSTGSTGGDGSGSDPGSNSDPAETGPIDISFTTYIANPLGEDMDIIDFLQKLFVNIVKIAFPFLVLFMMYSGFMFVEARGNEEKLSVAKKNFLYVIIGALLILGAWTIAQVLKGTVDEIEQPISWLGIINNLL